MTLIDLLFPKECLGCKRPGSYICSSCINKLSSIKLLCPECQKPAVDGITHIRCKKKLGMDALVNLWPYQGVIRQAVIKLKYKFVGEVAEELSELACKRIDSDLALFPKNATLIPVPLYWLRENFRGFNQSEKIGKILAKKMGWNFVPDLLVRRKLRQPQTQLTAEKRKENVKGVFSLNPNHQALQPKADRPLDETTNHILFDDVYTTGSTLKEATRVLKRNGAGQVWGLTIAK
ncbi:MAG: Phosphoribosyltransferase [Microgenomates group bacterium GW2011_GWC1_37_8]|uniref:Phosphoribosyltransferase n=1 Tax=Candidatus Woesebacteria bacterium GW2011_GWB1_38_8 TaxID=1618570 RepID=A0A0G0L113_9BACT|nr:MAG: Phosphoribosyltransferase [Microgenomates group bacterium GW2011_GWC1_37_8]KKQ85618.1 MAG: Phosphoribosyltransferase [Candidatus Woesebacteria bacterium GW2011_GWB1_38_8]